MLILYEMLHTCSIMHTQRRCKFENTISTDASGCFFTNVTLTAVAEIGIRGEFCETLSYIHWVQLVYRSSYLILNWRAYIFLLHIHVKYEYKIPFMIWKSQTTFSNVSSMKVFEFRLQFHWSPDYWHPPISVNGAYVCWIEEKIYGYSYIWLDTEHCQIMTIMKMIMIKTAQTPCQSLYKDRRF